MAAKPVIRIACRNRDFLPALKRMAAMAEDPLVLREVARAKQLLAERLTAKTKPQS